MARCLSVFVRVLYVLSVQEGAKRCKSERSGFYIFQ